MHFLVGYPVGFFHPPPRNGYKITDVNDSNRSEVDASKFILNLCLRSI